MSFGRRASLLGAGVTTSGAWAIGGAFTVLPDYSAVEVHADDEPGAVYRFVKPPGYGSDNIREFAQAQGMSGRAALAGDMLSDGRILYYGASGRLGANEFYRKAFRGAPSSYTTATLGIPYVPVEGGAPAGGAAPTPPPAEAPAPPPPWTGEQLASVQVTGQGIPENAKLFGADGRVYKIAAGSDEAAATWLATYAPQGPALVVKGTWDPGALLVKVTDAYIQATGSRGYGVNPEAPGELAPPSTEYPSTTPEGTGLMPAAPAAAPTTAGGGTVSPYAMLALGAVLAMIASSKGRR